MAIIKNNIAFLKFRVIIVILNSQTGSTYSYYILVLRWSLLKRIKEL